MTTIYNLEKCELSDRNGMYLGQAGSKEGIVFNGENWIIKYPKSTKSMKGNLESYTTSPLSEYIGSHVYEILGYDVHKTELGIRNGKLVVACKDFCEEGTSLREIRAIKNIYNQELEEQVEKNLSSTGSEHSTDLEEIMIHLNYNPVLKNIPGIKERFWECIAIDGLINNNDRNNGNWGLLYSNRHYSLAPIYDNGAAFSNKTPDTKIAVMLINPERIISSAINTISSYSLDGKQLMFRDIANLDNEDMSRAILKIVPLLEEKMGEINHFIDQIPEQYAGIPVCSADRKTFYKKSMDIRMEKILKPSYEKHLKKY